MDKLDLIFWAMGGGFSVMFALMILMWNSLNKRMDSIECRLEKLDEKITDIDRRLCRLEGAFSSKECCAITIERSQKKAE